ncbi:MAG: sigma-70 family RNA polymerase sigma factor [bacterium]
MFERTHCATPEATRSERRAVGEMSDADLVERVLTGDREAFGRLVDRYQQGVYNLAYAILGSWQDAQDIAQEAFFAAFRRLPELRDWNKFGNWLFGTTRHLCYVLLRRRRVVGEQVPLEDVEAFIAESPSTDEEDRIALTLNAIEKLPDKYQVLLRLKYLGGYSYRRISEMSDLPEVTVKSRLFEGRRMLREHIESLVRRHDGS